MKSKLINILPIGLLVIILCCGASSCQTPELFRSKPQVSLFTNQTPPRVEERQQEVPVPPQVVVITNTVEGAERVVYVTNYLPPIIITNTVLVPGSNVVTAVTNGFEANPQLIALLTQAKDANGMLNPTPTAPLVNGGIQAVIAGLGLIAAYQTRKLKQTQDQSQQVGRTLVENFETLRKAALSIPGYADIDHKVMDQVKNAQSMAGKPAKAAIQDLVEEHTHDTLT